MILKIELIRYVQPKWNEPDKLKIDECLTDESMALLETTCKALHLYQSDIYDLKEKAFTLVESWGEPQPRDGYFGTEARTTVLLEIPNA